jgi:hypothetical protein
MGWTGYPDGIYYIMLLDIKAASYATESFYPGTIAPAPIYPGAFDPTPTFYDSIDPTTAYPAWFEAGSLEVLTPGI